VTPGLGCELGLVMAIRLWRGFDGIDSLCYPGRGQAPVRPLDTDCNITIPWVTRFLDATGFLDGEIRGVVLEPSLPRKTTIIGTVTL
jgi:hypothetical protein